MQLGAKQLKYTYIFFYLGHSIKENVYVRFYEDFRQPEIQNIIKHLWCHRFALLCVTRDP